MMNGRRARATHLRSCAARMCVVLLVGLATSGCAIPIIGSLTLNQLATAVSMASTALSGKGLGEHALDQITGLDCRLFEGVVRQDREVCEAPGSAATVRDFRGLPTILTMMREPSDGAAPTVASRPAVARVGATAGLGVLEPAPRLILSLHDRSLPIRLTPMTATCRVPPLSRVKLGIGWSRGVARDAEQ